MKIRCLLKFIPDVENLCYDHERNILIRENVKMVLNPDDASALALALRLKKSNAGAEVEVISMAPPGALPLMEDLLRRGVDKGTLISDKLFTGSDTYATTRILGRYLEGVRSDLILTGTHTLDGDTSHVPSQIGELLKMDQLSHVTKVYEDSLESGSALVEVEHEDRVDTFEVLMPCILSIARESRYKLPFVRFEALELDVRDRINMITNEDLDFSSQEVGLEGSLTQVKRTFTSRAEKKEKIVVMNDDEGIDAVYKYLKARGFVG